MASALPPSRPAWVSDEIFPFESRFFTTDSGHRMHYVDEGDGEAVVFVHGNPTWSFEFRHLIRGLQPQNRCIAADHVGFGLSSRSSRSGDHHPRSHAQRFAELLVHLDVRDATLFLTDWGGPIGLDFARKHPDRVKRLVIANTWCWPVDRDRHFRLFSFMMSSFVGQHLIKKRNFFVNGVMPRAVADKRVLTPEVMAHYRNAQPTPDDRAACAAFPGFIVGATEWLRSVWHDRAAFTGKPSLILWGTEDIAFRSKELERWKSELRQPEMRVFNDSGHFIAEEIPDKALPALQAFTKQD